MALSMPSAALLNQPAIGHSSFVAEHSFVDSRSSEWDAAVSQHPEATIFHSSAWAKVLCDTYNHTPVYLRFNGGAGLLPMMEISSPITGRRGVSLPFSDFCPPLSFGECPQIISTLVELARERRWKYFELRSTPETISAIVPNKSFYVHRLDLQKPADELLENFDSAARRALRKAERTGMRVEICSDENAVDEFFALHSRTRRRHGIPPQSRAFFRNIHAHIIRPGLGFVAIARLASRAVAAAMFFHYGANGLFKFGASDERFQEHRPNNLLMWEGIKRCAQLGLKTLHLGRTDIGQEGLRRFKLSLGATEELLHYFRFDPASDRWLPESKAAPPSWTGAVFRRLPLTINQLAGTMLYPHLH